MFEVDLTPNRIDAASHYGVARDLAAWMKAQGMEANLHRPSVEAFATDRADGAIPVEVKCPEATIRYAGLTVRNVKVAESPEWLRNYLNAIGQRPINNIVDITNFVLNAFCQPLHCFDLAKVKGEKIVVRQAVEGSKFVTLDGVERTMSDRDLMICNAEEPMCIAGVFGGLDSGVTEATTDVFLESACFHPTWVRKTARRQALNTDASFRYERGVDANNAIYALKIAALLVKELAGGEICGDIFDYYPAPVERPRVELSYNYMTQLIGKALDKNLVKTILAALEMEIESETDDVATLRVPTYRVDVTRPCDVVEDILRIYGYNNVEFGDTVHSSLSYRQPTDNALQLQSLVSEQLTAAGYHEIMNNSLTAVSYYDGLVVYPLDNCVRLLNPLSNDLAVLRQTLIFGGLESLAHNINRKNANLTMYEFGNVYHFNPQVEQTEEKPLAQFSEETHLGLWMTGDLRTANWTAPAQKSTVFDLKASVENVFTRLGITAKEIVAKQTSNELFSACLEYTNRGGKLIGYAGVVSHKMLKKADISQPVYFAELNWNALVKMALKKKVEFTDLPKSMPVKRDLALLIDAATTFADVETVIRNSEKRLLKSVSLFDVYEGKNLEAGKKSYAVSMTLQDDEKTLNDKQIDAVMNKIIANLQKQLGAQLR